MRVKFFKRSYKERFESRHASTGSDVVSIHLSGDKFAFGIVLTKFLSRENGEWIAWHLLTVKIGRMDYKWRFMKGGDQ